MAALSVNGGTPVRSTPWPHYPIFGEREKKAAVRVVDSNWLVAHHGGSKEVDAFEKDFAEYIGCDLTLGIGNGTQALHLALAASNIGVGDEVIVPTVTFMATATSVLMQNAVPVFADSEPFTLGLDPKKVEEKITSRTKAIIPVHLYGYPADMDGLLRVAKKHNLTVIEDCSHAHGAEYHGKKVGTLGDIGVFSLQQKKNLSTGDGALFVTKHPEYADAVRKLRSFGHEELSYNYRMTEVAAAIGQIRLTMLNEHNRVRRNNAAYLESKLSGLHGIKVRKPMPETSAVYYSFIFEYDPDSAGVELPVFLKAVQAEGIPLAPCYKPVHRQSTFHPEKEPARGCPWKWKLYQPPEDERPSYENGVCPLAEDYADHRIAALKIHPPVSEADLDDAALAIRKVIENSRELSR
jgi:perosamine synthetase